MAKREKSLHENINLRLGRTVNEMMLKLSPTELVNLANIVRIESLAEDLVYEDADGKQQVIPLLLRPRIISREQRRFFQKVCLEIVKALQKLYRLWATDKEVRKLLPLTRGELAWFDAMPKDSYKAPQSIFGRLDVQVDFGDPNWQAQCHFFEANTVGAGGIHYTPVADNIIMTSVIPKIQEQAPGFVVQAAGDPRQLLLHTLTHHADQIGLRRLNIGFMQDRRSTGGPEEFPSIVRYFQSKNMVARLVDPRDLTVRNNELYDGDQALDILYRDTMILELAGYEDEGSDLSAARWAFANNRVVSSIAGEFDHKSALEILSDPRFHGHFTATQVKMFTQYVPWTRTVRETRTPDSTGQEVDLVPFIRKNRDGLVLKPNRGLGGQSIVIGPFVEIDAWDQAISTAVKEPGEWVVQRYVPSLVKDFPVITEDGRVQLEEYYVVCGFYPTLDGLGILGRASKKRVVNVAQKGGLVSYMVLS